MEHIRDVLRRAIWASLTGGYFYDPQIDLFSNTVHLYLFLLFSFLPLGFYMVGCVVLGAEGLNLSFSSYRMSTAGWFTFSWFKALLSRSNWLITSCMGCTMSCR